MPCLAPTINSYKRLVENFWAPVTVSWGYEHRSASIRLIAPPSCPAAATRFEIRTPGADCNAHFALGAVLAAGFKGIEDKMELTLAPLGKGEETGGQRLAADLKSATEAFMAKDSWARVLLGDDFVDHFGGTRKEEVRRWEEAVTDWEFKRYTETV
jgi:glutamine synthetase